MSKQPKQQSAVADPAISDEQLFSHAIRAIGHCLEGAPDWTASADSRSAHIKAIAYAEAYSAAGSPRRMFAAGALLAWRHHNLLAERRADLQAAGSRFVIERADAVQTLDSRTEVLKRAELAHAEVVGKHDQLTRTLRDLLADLDAPVRQAEGQVLSADQELRDAIAREEQVVIRAASAQLSKEKQALAAANAALTQGQDAEVLAALRRRIAELEVCVIEAARQLEDARVAVDLAQRRLRQIDIDHAVAAACDRIVWGMYNAGQVGVHTPDVVIKVSGVDEQRVPLIGAGMQGFLKWLCAPDYGALEVDLQPLSDVAAPVAPVPFYDERATRAANRTAPQAYPPHPARPGERRPTVTYSDPERAAVAARVVQIEA